ncbi:zinc finger protein 782-like [Culicoides brevitarsis]|uniref:zinc finger protein 782-like n=1 Tax=Culicoides brevitarsis TaxID=469753 RepID=UPI00307BCA57
MIKDEKPSEELLYENIEESEVNSSEEQTNLSTENDEPLDQYLDTSLQRNRRSYKCPKCFKYYTRGELRYHLNVHNNIRPFKCVKDGCSSTFSSPRIMRVHAKRFHQLKVEAEKSTYSRRCIRDQRYREMDDTCSDEKQEKTKINVICSICGKEVRKKHFSTHYRTHYAEKYEKYPCPYKSINGCDERFKKRHLLTMHIQRNHDSSYLPELGPADRICELCGKCFSKATIKYHMNVHFNLTPYSCDYEGCKESFKDPTLLRQHKRSFHLGIKTWRCRYCPKKILSQKEYEEHKTENCGIKSVPCHICGKVINKMNVKCHLAIHKGERNFICSIEGCGKAFLLKNKLQQHSKSHSTELKFECKLCKSAFKVKQSLTTHIAKKHPNASENDYYKDS